MSRVDSTRGRKDESSSDEKGADDVRDSRRDTSFNEGSYTVKIVGGMPQKVPLSADTVDGVQLRHRGKPKPTKKADRRISCKDLGQGDCQGWLEKKKYTRGIMQSKWVKRWFVLKSKILYYYRDKTDLKAEGLITLPGYQVSQAPEIKRKKFAFKLHHTGTTFYFASDRLEDMSKWMNKMGLCSINFDMARGVKASPFAKPGAVPKTIEEQETPYHSESDEESEESRDGTSDTSSISSTPSLTDEQASSKSTHSPQHGEKTPHSPQHDEKTLAVEPLPECHSAGSSPTGRRRQGTVMAPGVKITITQDERNPVSGKEQVELHPPDMDPPEVELRHRSRTNKEKTNLNVQPPDQSLESGFKTPDALCHMLDKHDLTIDGKNRKSLRRTIIARSTMATPLEFDRVKKLQSLERTLKDKESDLKAIDSLLLAEPITSDKLKNFKLKHPYLFDKFLETAL